MPPSSQQENYDSEPHSSRKRSAKDDTNDEDIDTELLDSLFISFVPPCNEDHLLIHGFGATDAFYKLQPSILTHKWKHSLEDYIHYALATNSILFLSPPIHVLTTFCRFSTSIIWKLPLPTNTVMEIIQVTQDLIANKITREMAVIKLFKMDLATNEYKFAKAVAKLARKLPRMSFAEESNEMELCSRHVDPFLSGLLDEGIFLRWNDFKIKKKTAKPFVLASWHLYHQMTRHAMEVKYWVWGKQNSHIRLRMAIWSVETFYASRFFAKTRWICKRWWETWAYRSLVEQSPFIVWCSLQVVYMSCMNLPKLRYLIVWMICRNLSWIFLTFCLSLTFSIDSVFLRLILHIPNDNAQP